MIRLSVVIPTYNRKALCLRAIRSVLDQEQVFETEIIVVDDGSTDGTAEHLQGLFAAEIAAGKLRIETPPRRGDPGSARNSGAKIARGEHLAFLDSDDYWKPGRLKWLAPLLGQYDLILCQNANLTEAARDPLAMLLRINTAITSATVIRKDLFEKLGGFAPFYYGPHKKLIPGWEDYELWLRALCVTSRVLIARNEYVVSDHEPESAGSVGLKNQMLREAFTLMRVLPQVPPRYWSLLPRRLVGALKAGVLG